MNISITRTSTGGVIGAVQGESLKEYIAWKKEIQSKAEQNLDTRSTGDTEAVLEFLEKHQGWDDQGGSPEQGLECR